MKFKTLMAVAVAGAFAVPLAALAQGAGGTTTAPSADHPQGNPPYTAPAGSQDDKAANPSASAQRSKNKGHMSKEDKNAAGAGSTSSSTPSTSGTTNSGAGNMGSGSTGSTMGTPKSPSSGGPASGTGSKNSSTDPK